MFITTPNYIDPCDIEMDIDTALCLARECYSNYFEDTPVQEKENTFAWIFYNNRDNIGRLIGAAIDYMRSAKELITAYEAQERRTR